MHTRLNLPPFCSVRFPSHFNNSTIPYSLYTNYTRTSNLSTSLSSSFASTTTSTKSRSSSSRLRTTTSSTAQPTFAVADTPGGDNAGAGAPTPSSTPGVTSGDSDSDGPGLSPETQNAVIGGVVGSVAGIAIVALVLMFLLKWRRNRYGGAIRLLGDGDSTVRGSRGGPGAGGPSGGTGGGADAIRRSIPFAIPSSLASLTGHHNNSHKQQQQRMIEGPGSPASDHSVGSAAAGEKGFYRVSGKKLVSVLESGGDGYSDPPGVDNRYSTLSAASSHYYRDSTFFGEGAPAMQRLQLGSPMRPVSGVPVIRTGPMRTPVMQEESPFADPPPSPPAPTSSLTPPKRIDPLGRSLISQDGSRGSGSRFTEDMG